MKDEKILENEVLTDEELENVSGGGPQIAIDCFDFDRYSGDF